MDDYHSHQLTKDVLLLAVVFEKFIDMCLKFYEKLAVSYEMLSDYCKKIAKKYEIKVGDVKKLIPNLGNKTNYVLHYRDLQLYLSLGMKLKKIHRTLKFKQSDWMKKYIDFNNEKRKNAGNSFEKDFFKIDD